MKFQIYLGCLLVMVAFNDINCFCSSKKNALTTSQREYFVPGSSEKCKELIIGPFTTSRTLVVVFNSTAEFITCPSDNILVYDENRALVLDFCELKKTKIVKFATKVAKQLSVVYNYGSNQLFTVSFDWYILGSASDPATPNKAVCGLPSVQMSKNTARVVGGVDAVPYSHPWLVYIATKTEGLYCSGSLINDQWILTSAECTNSRAFEYISAGVFNLNPTADQSFRQDLKIGGVFVHPKYNVEGINDIALLKLQTPVKFTKQVSAVCLPTVAPDATSSVILAGWGLTDFSGTAFSDTLKQAYTNLKENSKCQSDGISLTQSELCAGTLAGGTSSAKDGCDGDLGSALVTKGKDNRYYINGLFSFSPKCDGNGIYSNVFAYLNWINATMIANA